MKTIISSLCLMPWLYFSLAYLFYWMEADVPELFFFMSFTVLCVGVFLALLGLVLSSMSIRDLSVNLPSLHKALVFLHSSYLIFSLYIISGWF